MVWSSDLKIKRKIYKVGHEYPGEGAALLWQPGLPSTCSLQHSQKDIIQGECISGVLIVPIHRDTQIDKKTEKGGVVKRHIKQSRK